MAGSLSVGQGLELMISSVARGVIRQIAAGGVIAVLLLLMALKLAAVIGPLQLGVFSGLLSWSLIFWPIVSLRLETRVSLCSTEHETQELVSALIFMVVMASLIATVALLVALCFFEWISLGAVFVPLAAASYALHELCGSVSAFRNEMTVALVVRSIRQVIPLSMALLVAVYYPFGDFAFLAYALSSVVLAGIVGGVVLGDMTGSVKALRRQCSFHSSGLKASLLLGVSNMIWLNGLSPLLNVLGMSVVAGQYAVVQRIFNAPYGVITAVVNSYLLRETSTAHSKIPVILSLVTALFCGALALSSIGYWVLYGQSYISISVEWLVDEVVYLSIAFFMSSSFAVGALSVVSIRIRDEWFLSCWQIFFVMLGVAIIFWFSSLVGFVVYLVLGGLAYWILLFRWIYKVKYCECA